VWRWHGPITPWRRTLHARERAARVARRARPASSSGRSLTVAPCARCLVAHLSCPAAVRRLCVCVCVLQRFPASPQGASTSDSVCLRTQEALPVRFALPLCCTCSARAQLGLPFPASCTRRHHASRGEDILRGPASMHMIDLRRLPAVGHELVGLQRGADGNTENCSAAHPAGHAERCPVKPHRKNCKPQHPWLPLTREAHMPAAARAAAAHGRMRARPAAGPAEWAAHQTLSNPSPGPGRPRAWPPRPR